MLHGKLAAAFLVVVLAMSMAAPPSSTAQEPSTDSRVYIEMLGAGLVWSLNYEFAVSDKFGMRLGVGGSPISGWQYVIGLGMPTLLLGDGPHRAVLAAGAGIGWIEDVDLLEAEEVFVGYGVASIGYQFQPEPTGFFLRAAFTPVFTDQEFSPWGGLSMGTKF